MKRSRMAPVAVDGRVVLHVHVVGAADPVVHRDGLGEHLEDGVINEILAKFDYPATAR